jgi:cytochrome bd-type quinol oxidase subunit 2
MNQQNAMPFAYIVLVYVALAAVLLVMGLGAWVITKTPEDADIETRKLRFAAATFTGITMLFVFVSVLYFVSPADGPGKQIFDKGFTAMFTLAGTIVGYLFGSDRAGRADEKSRAKQTDTQSVAP